MPMSNDIIPVEGPEKNGDRIFSAYTHPELERFIERVIYESRDALPTAESQKLLREFFLYGVIKATGYELERSDFKSKWSVPNYGVDEAGRFYTNNGILAVCDFDGDVYIRGGNSYHGYFDSGDLAEMLFVQGMEGTLLHCGYTSRGIWVPHSNGETYADTAMEKIFGALHNFSRSVRNLRGEPTSGLIIKDLSEEEPPAPYPMRDEKLPRIEFKNVFLIPGNRERTISVR